MKRKQLSSHAKIGIINRGEAAVRFIRAVKEFKVLHGIDFETIAFHLDVESDALFVKEADHSYALSSFAGYSELTGSPYLACEFLLKALQETGCSGVWVGWGFVAENAEFAALLEANELVLIGPSSEAMDRLGDKIKAKDIADRSQVPTCPWSGGPLESLEHAQIVAEKIGYPVILKSANGGGGRGIRKVFTRDELAQQFRSVSDEIFRFFGNRVIFMEALVVRGRHLEVQCLADTHGNVHTFGVRDCSVQRNNQKIIEETPPAHLAAAAMQEVEASAARLLKAAEYHGAGTVEYLYDLDRKQAFFMEVNTRLQVEHPITEELFQVDLVHLQLRTALGEELKEIPKQPRGHVIEVRLNAEDPDQKFAPTPGRILRFLPPNLPGIRFDSGFEWGSSIPREFDSMVAKIIAYGPNRAAALARLTRALTEMQIEIENGTTNQGFLLELLASPEVKQGGVQTDFVEQFLNSPQRNQSKSHWDIALLAAVIYQYEQKYKHEFENFTEKVRRYSSPRQMPNLEMDLPINLKGHKYQIKVQAVDDPIYHIQIDDQHLEVEYVNWGHEIILKTGGRKYPLQIIPRTNALQCEVAGIPYMLPFDGGGKVSAPSPSVVLTVDVQEGKKVKKGELLLTLEAMKMEMAVTAPEDGVIIRLNVKVGEQVAAGQTLLDLETESNRQSKEGTDKVVAAIIDYTHLALAKQPRTSAELEAVWNHLERDYSAVFIGFDFATPVGAVLQRIESFLSDHPNYKTAFAHLLIRSLRRYITVQKLFQNANTELEGTRSTDVYECLMHYLMRREDREKGLPEAFLARLDAAIQIYPWADKKNHEATTRALFHLYKAQAGLRQTTELIRQSLLALQKLYSDAREFTEVEVFSDLLNELIGVSRHSNALVDAAIFMRYELVDRLSQEEMQQERRAQLVQLLEPVLGGHTKDPQQLADIIESGHQIVSYLVSLYDRKSARAAIILELLTKRFNRDRVFKKGTLLEHKGFYLYEVQSQKNAQNISCVVTILDEEEYFSSLEWLRSVLKKEPGRFQECVIFVRRKSEPSELIYTNHLAKFPLPVDLCSLALVRANDYTYRSFHYNNNEWSEDIRRRSFSPLRFRELRLDRFVNFELELLYNSRYVHVVKLEAKDNAKDQRLMALIEVPETKIALNEEQVIERISQFEYGMLEAVKVIREQQARHKRSYYWNRIIVHIGHTHPLRLDHIGVYPKRITGLIEGLGLEKMVIYTKVLTRQNRALETEVLIENFATQYSVRGRLPSREPLKPLDPYASKVVNALRLQSPYPYEVVRMLCNSDRPEFPQGKFIEYDIQFDASGNQQTISVEGREPGLNKSNTVIGRIQNRDPDGTLFERILILGDPTRDLGSLAEDECRRVMAAIDLAESEFLPVEWIPVSSGAAIDMQTGTENLDWTARVLRRLIEFTQAGGEVNIIVAGINVGAQSYWNAEATMLMHTKGILIMTDQGSMVLTGKKALDFSGSVSAEDNIGIGGVERIMGPNGQAQFRVKDLAEAYRLLFRHYRITMVSKQRPYGSLLPTKDAIDRDVADFPYQDRLNQNFSSIGDILGVSNSERKKPFDMRQVMHAVRDQDADYLERWQTMRDAETAIVWETQVCGYPVGMIGIESRPVKRFGDFPNDGPDMWTGGTLFPHSSKKVARAINAYSEQMPVVILANLSGFDGSPESLRRLQLEYGAEIGRAVVNFKGPLIFVVVARYHGGAYVVFSKTLNPSMRIAALEATYASVIGGAPAAAVVFPRQVLKNTFADPQIVEAQARFKKGELNKSQYDDIYQTIHLEQQAKVAQEFEKIHTVERARRVGSVDDILSVSQLRPYLKRQLESGIQSYLHNTRD
ncbi:MAG: ATP-grasp domain-containing protein [Proteobacteria bacterium]|nr:ATP-grasp domain-containing protein [Pseudomonadota bacterium]